jgi:aspartate racemase
MALDGWQTPVVGVLGGLGPAATVSFLDQLVRFTDAATDQDHIDAIVLQHSSTPDRTAAILDPTAPSPAPTLAADVRRLQEAGADFWVLPCNTAHWFVSEIAQATPLPGISIVSETAAAAVKRPGPISVFATQGTIHSGVYQDELARLGHETLPVDADVQDRLMRIIYDQVKAGQPVDLAMFIGCIEDTLAAGAATIILGCTELSVVYDRHGLDDRPELVDSLRCLVHTTINRCGKAVRTSVLNQS